MEQVGLLFILWLTATTLLLCRQLRAVLSSMAENMDADSRLTRTKAAEIVADGRARGVTILVE